MNRDPIWQQIDDMHNEEERDRDMEDEYANYGAEMEMGDE